MFNYNNMGKMLSFVVVAALLVLVGAGCNYQVNINDQSADQPAVGQDQTASQPTGDANQNEGEETTLTGTDQQTANWKTNANPLGMPVTYQYPSNWKIDKAMELETGSVSGANGNPIFEIFEERELSGVTPKQAFEKQKNGFESITFEQATTIDGQEAYLANGQTWPNSGKDWGEGMEKIYVKYNDKIYTLQFIDFDKKRVEDSPFYATYKKILETISFTKPVSADSTKTKVSVQDIKNAFTTKYPNIDYSSYNITIENNYQEQFVEGGVGAPEGGGSHYWAAKVNEKWVIAATAQDSIPCNVFAPYGFPSEIIGNDCY